LLLQYLKRLFIIYIVQTGKGGVYLGSAHRQRYSTRGGGGQKTHFKIDGLPLIAM
jgi:hypothetical protein